MCPHIYACLHMCTEATDMYAGGWQGSLTDILCHLDCLVVTLAGELDRDPAVCIGGHYILCAIQAENLYHVLCFAQRYLMQVSS